MHIQDFRMDFGETTVIRDPSFDVHAGETVRVLGSRGTRSAGDEGAWSGPQRLLLPAVLLHDAG